MNQDQRKFLIEQVTKTCRAETDKVSAEMPTKPSLNNYLVAACLDDSIQLCDVEGLKKKIRERVLKFGKDELLVKENDEWRRRNSNNEVTLKAEDLFVIPEAYKKALAEYQAKKAQLDKRIEELEAQKNTIIMKIQIGSNAVLDKLVLQIDSLGDLNLMNSQLQLGTGGQ